MATFKSSTGLAVQDIEIASSAADFKQLLLAEISQATSRIYISALYIQDDEAGREVLAAIYQAKAQQPQLDVRLFVAVSYTHLTLPTKRIV